MLQTTPVPNHHSSNSSKLERWCRGVSAARAMEPHTVSLGVQIAIFPYSCLRVPKTPFGGASLLRRTRSFGFGSHCPFHFLERCCRSVFQMQYICLSSTRHHRREAAHLKSCAKLAVLKIMRKRMFFFLADSAREVLRAWGFRRVFLTDVASTVWSDLERIAA